ncbi:MAG: putative anti-sigma regulatory factor, serine/threonine protein kinase [Acidimicrobiales bacterium]|nr:putative anti-sigma regulatory factor, serine/threonine protein kinase [Acidimicrobiales bacterium]
MSERIELPPTPGSVAVARRWSVEQVEPELGSDLAATVALLVSELVTNVVLHARTPCQLVLRWVDHRLRVEVHDESDHLPAKTLQRDPIALSGRGMQLVEAMSDAHGAEGSPGGGKLVWFELDLASPPAVP